MMMAFKFKPSAIGRSLRSSRIGSVESTQRDLIWRGKHSATEGKQLDAQVVTTLQTIERLLSSRGTINADKILENISILHKHRFNIPQSYFMDAASVLCARNDPVRAELLIHLCRDNVQLQRNSSIVHKFSHKDDRNDSVNKLVSFTISSLHRYGSAEDASKFWVKMSNSGYKTDRGDMEKILDYLVGSSRSAPTLEFISSLHAAMKAHLWHQCPAYYSRMLKVLRQHVYAHCTGSAQLHAALAKLDALWSDALRSTGTCDPAVAHLTALPAELYALRVSVLAAAMQALRRSRVPAEDEGAKRCRADAIKAFEDFLSVQRHPASGNTSLSGGGCEDATVRALVQEMRGILCTSSDSANSLNTSAGLAGSPPIKASGSVINFTLNSAQGDVRRSVQQLLTELASQGQPSEAATLLGTFLQTRRTGSTPTWSPTAPTPLASHAGERATTSANVIASVLSALAARSGGAFVATDPVTHSAADVAAEQYRAGERAWQAELVCTLMRNCNAAVPALQRGETQLDQGVFDGLYDAFTQLREHLIEHQLKPGARFYASYIAALRNNMRFLQGESQRAAQELVKPGVPTISWSEALDAVNSFLATAPSAVQASSEVAEALVSLLCQGSGDGATDREGVQHAHRIALEGQKRGVLLSSSALCALLEGATHSLDDARLSEVLRTVESFAAQTRRADFGQEDVVGDRSVLRERIFAHCRLREGFVGLKLLRELKRSGDSADRRTYDWILQALYNSMPRNSTELEMASTPANTINFLLREMHKDGLAPTSRTLGLMLRLYAKAVQIDHEDDGNRSSLLQEMDSFVESFAKLVDESVVREVVKAHCVCGDTEGATKALMAMCEKYDVRPTAAAYEPILFHLAVMRGDLNAAEDVLMGLVNAAVPLSEAVVAAFAVGLMRYGELSEALDAVQDMFNQHRVRPPSTVWTGLLDASLVKGDVMEARRVVYLLRQLFTPEERAAMVGWALPGALDEQEDAEIEGSDTAEVSEAAAFMRKLHEVQEEGSGEDGTKKKRANAALRRREAALAAYWTPAPPSEDTATAAGTRRRLGARTATSSKPAQPAPVPGYLIRLGVPLGQTEKGALSDAGLQRRFLRFGLQLE